jgi:predicted DNA-binding protein YlxM (UPF0122 family)
MCVIVISSQLKPPFLNQGLGNQIMIYEGYNYQEIAEVTSLSESQVKVYIFRARKKMKDYLVKLDLVL